MQALKERIEKEGTNLGRGILKVDSFLNHQIDPKLMDAVGKELARRFALAGATRILTAEISGIAPAVATGLHMGLPVVYARKHRPITMPETAFRATAPSHTKGNLVELLVSPEYLFASDKILIIDDFLATGKTLMGLIDIVKQAGAQLVGIGAVIEKSFEGGRDLLSQFGVQLESVAIITNLSDGKIELAN